MKIPNDILNSDIDLFNTELVQKIYLFFKFSENDEHRSYIINYFLTNIKEEHPAMTWNVLHNIIMNYIRPSESEDNPSQEEKKVVRALLKEYFPNIVFFLNILPSKFEKENCLEAFIYESYLHKWLLAYFYSESDESYSPFIEALLKCTKDFVVKKGIKLNNNDICNVMIICKNYPHLPLFHEDCISEKIMVENGREDEAWLLHLLSINLDIQYNDFPNYNASYACRFLKSSVKIVYPSIYEKLLTIFCLKQLQYS